MKKKYVLGEVRLRGKLGRSEDFPDVHVSLGVLSSHTARDGGSGTGQTAKRSVIQSPTEQDTV